MDRPAVDVVVPFAGPTTALRSLLHRLEALVLQPDDTLTVVDNRRRTDRPEPPAGLRLVEAVGRRSSYHARNRGAAAGDAPWILFIDSDVDPVPDLVERYLRAEPGRRTAVLAGAVVDAPVGPDGPVAARYAELRSAMSQEATLGHGRWAFAKTANCAVRRTAFSAAGGFADDVRSGGDADLCWRLAAAGWELERRPGAIVVHRNRENVGAMLRQLARHGSGAAWLGRRHPGALPRRPVPGIAWWGVRRGAAGAVALLRGQRDEALLGLLDGPALWAFEAGRLLPNQVRR